MIIRHSLLFVVVWLSAGVGLGRAQDFKNPLNGPPLPGTKN